MLLLYQSAYQTPAPSYPHLWTRPWDTWTPPLGEANHSLARVDNPPFFLDLEVLTLIPTTSHLVTNHPSKRWRSQPDKAIRTTSSANNSDATLRTPYWTTPASCSTLRSCPWIPQTEYETRDSPGGVQHSLGTSLTYYQECKITMTVQKKSCLCLSANIKISMRCAWQNKCQPNKWTFQFPVTQSSPK